MIFFQFRALADQMYKSSEYHKHVRKEVVNQVSEIVSICIFNFGKFENIP